jgi:anti-sigma-K factor RskA
LKPTDSFAEIAQLSGPGDSARLSAALSADRTTLELRASRPVIAGPAQSYELWLIPAEGGAPVSLAVLGSLDAKLTLPAQQAARLTRGAKLAVSVEPAGGSPTGAPTGPVLFAGAIGA